MHQCVSTEPQGKLPIIFHMMLEPIPLMVCLAGLAGTLVVPLQQNPRAEGANPAGLTLESACVQHWKRLAMVAV